MITSKEDCIKINANNILNKSIKLSNQDEVLYLKDNKLYQIKKDSSWLSFLGYNDVN